jgi:hypothetical protein
MHTYIYTYTYLHRIIGRHTYRQMFHNILLQGMMYCETHGTATHKTVLMRRSVKQAALDHTCLSLVLIAHISQAVIRSYSAAPCYSLHGETKKKRCRINISQMNRLHLGYRFEASSDLNTAQMRA